MLSYQFMAHTTELLITGGVDTLCMLEAQDAKISVPFCEGTYIPYGISEGSISPGHLNVERAEEVGEHAVRLFLLNQSVEEPFGIVTYNDWQERLFVKTPKTQDLIIESDDSGAQWRTILNTESTLSDSDREAFSNMLRKLRTYVRDHKRQGRL